MQPALAVAVEAGLADADSAWTVFLNQTDFPNYNSGYPQWGVIPGKVIIKTNLTSQTAQYQNDFNLAQNYPNPFNSQTKISFSISVPSGVKISVFNLSGQKVCTLLDEFRPAGHHQVTWNGKDASGREQASGLYIYSLKVGENTINNKLFFIK
jgi:hypothetical protein